MADNHYRCAALKCKCGNSLKEKYGIMADMPFAHSADDVSVTGDSKGKVEIASSLEPNDPKSKAELGRRHSVDDLWKPKEIPNEILSVKPKFKKPPQEHLERPSKDSAETNDFTFCFKKCSQVESASPRESRHKAKASVSHVKHSASEVKTEKTLKKRRSASEFSPSGGRWNHPGKGYIVKNRLLRQSSVSSFDTCSSKLNAARKSLKKSNQIPANINQLFVSPRESLRILRSAVKANIGSQKHLSVSRQRCPETPWNSLETNMSSFETEARCCADAPQRLQHAVKAEDQRSAEKDSLVKQGAGVEPSLKDKRDHDDAVHSDQSSSGEHSESPPHDCLDDDSSYPLDIDFNECINQLQAFLRVECVILVALLAYVVCKVLQMIQLILRQQRR